MLKQISDTYIPNESIQEFFSPPKMPHRLYKSMSRMKRKNTIKTEQTLYSAQSEIFMVSKPLITALVELKPLGSQVSKARELMSISLQGLYSVSLKISKARRENVRFLFKEALAEVLYTYAPNHVSIFGGDSFSSQIELAAKEAKLDLSWSSYKPKKKLPFRKTAHQGFGNQRYNNQRQGFQQPRRKYNNNNNTNKNTNSKKKQGKTD